MNSFDHLLYPEVRYVFNYAILSKVLEQLNTISSFNNILYNMAPFLDASGCVKACMSAYETARKLGTCQNDVAGSPKLAKYFSLLP